MIEMTGGLFFRSETDIVLSVKVENHCRHPIPINHFCQILDNGINEIGGIVRGEFPFINPLIVDFWFFSQIPKQNPDETKENGVYNGGDDLLADPFGRIIT